MIARISLRMKLIMGHHTRGFHRTCLILILKDSGSAAKRAMNLVSDSMLSRFQRNCTHALNALKSADIRIYFCAYQNEGHDVFSQFWCQTGVVADGYACRCGITPFLQAQETERCARALLALRQAVFDSFTVFEKLSQAGIAGSQGRHSGAGKEATRSEDY